MTDIKREILELSVRKLLSGEKTYKIPVYQRNYAWSEKEIEQLIEDIAAEKDEDTKYFIGTLVTHKNKSDDTYEVIDGQQRLTTIFLLISFFKNNDFSHGKLEKCIKFECRPNSKETLDNLFDNGAVNNMDENIINIDILNGYQIIENKLKNIIEDVSNENKNTSCEDDKKLENFFNFLLDSVIIVQVELPDNTNLNHYFEIMNSRGEQLEQHEILKARFIEKLEGSQQEKYIFCKIWDACSNMDEYIQISFRSEEIFHLFGDKRENFSSLSFDCLCEKFKSDNKKEYEQSIGEIINSNINLDDQTDDDEPKRFESIINFPNFLLHTLRIYTEENVPLNDKYLLDNFNNFFLEDANAGIIKNFSIAMLKCKYLYDCYIIKGDSLKGKNQWVLKQLKENADANKANRKIYYMNAFGGSENEVALNKEILMLLSAFHVSNPSPSYKHWLNGALHWLYKQNTEQINSGAYLEHLENLARYFVFKKFLVDEEKEATYYEIIYENEIEIEIGENYKEITEHLKYGKIQNNFIFNYLDYLLWKKYKEEYKEYEFTFRSSIEHHYPQKPSIGNKELEYEDLHSFGNLCLISHGKNSRLGNRMPDQKKVRYGEFGFDSIKQRLMMNKFDVWDEKAIKEHCIEMCKILIRSAKYFDKQSLPDA